MLDIFADIFDISYNRSFTFIIWIESLAKPGENIKIHATLNNSNTKAKQKEIQF